MVWGAKAQITLKAVYQNKRYLLKLHGDVEERTDRVLTLSEYTKTYGAADPSRLDFEKPLPHLLRLLLTTRPVLFLGCSLNQDRVVKFLKHVAETNPDLPHYAVVEHPGSKAFRRAQLYFSEHGIRPIWYPKGEHKFVELIVEYLSNEISDNVPTRATTQVRREIVPGLKATEALEVLMKERPDRIFFPCQIQRQIAIGRAGPRSIARLRFITFSCSSCRS